MSWFTAELRRHVPAARDRSFDIQTGISTATSSIAGIFDEKHRENLTAGFDFMSTGINKVGQNLFAQDEGSVWGKGSQMLHSFRDMRHHPAFGFADKAADYMIPDKYQDVFKGTPQIGIPNIPMPGHGAVKYLNDRTQQLRYVQNKLQEFNTWGNDIIRKGGEVLGYPMGHPKYDDSPAAAAAAAKPVKVKGSGSLQGKPARFAMNTGGKNEGRRSLKIRRSGRGGSGGDGAGFFKSYRSGRRSE